MFSLSLSDPQGKYQVGATTFARPVSPFVVGTAKLVSDDQLLPALQLDEVAFTAYYPAQAKGFIKGLDWLIRCATQPESRLSVTIIKHFTDLLETHSEGMYTSQVREHATIRMPISLNSTS